jgi:aldehyde oxidoreductase
MDFILNGEQRDFQGDPEGTLLDYLREHEGIITAKKGCNDEAACGCCAVQVDSKGILSCVTKMSRMEGKSVTTVDGLDQRLQEAFADAFVEKGGIQCGFCIPGFVMQAKVLLDKNPDPTREEVVKAFNMNLCRCTGYVKIVDSILEAAQAIRKNKPVPREDTTGRVGKRFRKYECGTASLGFRPYVDDMKMPGLLFAALKLSDYPRAKVLSINTGEAENLDGVVRIFTAGDVPGERNMGLIVQDWPIMIGEGEEARYIGDVLAGVVADSEATARKGVDLIEIEYEIKEPVTDVFEALEEEAAKIHPTGNILYQNSISRGDVDKTLAESAYTTKGRYTTQRVEHAFMEPESCLVEPFGSNGFTGLRVYSQSQGVFDDRAQLASLLAMPQEDIHVVQVQCGGAFGGKEDMLIQGHVALFAYHLKVPVKLTLNREESLIMHPKRHPFIMDYEVGCDKDGKLTGLKADLVLDTGAYASVGMKVAERGLGHATGAYSVPNVFIKSKAVYTNNIPCGAFRGFGVNQVAFAMERCVEDLCEQGGFDRWQVRYDNVIRDGTYTTTGQKIEGGCGLQETLLAVKDHFYEAKYAGIACGIKNTGIGNGMPDTGECRIDIVSEDSVVIYHGWTEMGQGAHNMAIQTFCEETRLDPEIVDVVVDTSANTVCGMTTASRATSLIGNSVIDACKELNEDLATHSLGDLAGKSYRGKWVCDWTTKSGHPNEKGEQITHYSYGYATQLVTLDEKGKIDTVYAAHDAGRVMNPNLFEGQIEGAIHMGLGYALTEDLPMENGYLKSKRFVDCGVLKPRYMPKVEVIGVECPDPHGPYGAKGVGEIGLVPTAGAVANALYQFDKKPRNSLPLKEKNVLG